MLNFDVPPTAHSHTRTQKGDKTASATRTFTQLLSSQSQSHILRGLFCLFLSFLSREHSQRDPESAGSDDEQGIYFNPWKDM